MRRNSTANPLFCPEHSTRAPTIMPIPRSPTGRPRTHLTVRLSFSIICSISSISYAPTESGNVITNSRSLWPISRPKSLVQRCAVANRRVHILCPTSSTEFLPPMRRNLETSSDRRQTEPCKIQLCSWARRLATSARVCSSDHCEFKNGHPALVIQRGCCLPVSRTTTLRAWVSDLGCDYGSVCRSGWQTTWYDRVTPYIQFTYGGPSLSRTLRTGRTSRSAVQQNELVDAG